MSAEERKQAAEEERRQRQAAQEKAAQKLAQQAEAAAIAAVRSKALISDFHLLSPAELILLVNK